MTTADAATKRLCLRQNAITRPILPPETRASVRDLDLYDNLISHLSALDDMPQLTSLDLSFNKIRHIRHLNRLEQLRDLFFVQNRISQIEGLDNLTKLVNLELGANRIRVIRLSSVRSSLYSIMPRLTLVLDNRKSG